jgi:DNA-binding CsgD family transcriptional regulator
MALKLQTYVLDTALKTIQEKAKLVRDAAVNVKAQVDAGPVQSDIVVGIMRNLKVQYDIINAAKATPGLNDYAKVEFDDPTLDYVAEVDAALAAMATCFAWVNTNFPKDANGYLLKSMEPDEVVDAIQRAQRGETVVAPAMTAKLVNLYDQKGQDSNSLLDALTPREREILTHLARGESNKAIARTLDISHDTVKLHVRHILAKLNLSSRVEAAVFAVEHRVAPGGRGEGR